MSSLCVRYRAPWPLDCVVTGLAETLKDVVATDALRVLREAP
jgi:hypothetical protein